MCKEEYINMLNELLCMQLKPGDKLYEPRKDRGIISVYKITEIIINEDTVRFRLKLLDGIYSTAAQTDLWEIGKTVFREEEEAHKVIRNLDIFKGSS